MSFKPHAVGEPRRTTVYRQASALRLLNGLTKAGLDLQILDLGCPAILLVARRRVRFFVAWTTRSSASSSSRAMSASLSCAGYGSQARRKLRPHATCVIGSSHLEGCSS